VAADYTIDTKTQSIRITFSGAVSITEMYESRRKMLADAAFDCSFSHLVDVRAVETIEMNGFTIKDFAQEQTLAGSARRAIVISRSHDAGLPRMFQIFRELAGGKEAIEIFGDMRAAQKWLGLSPGNPWDEPGLRLAAAGNW